MRRHPSAGRMRERAAGLPRIGPAADIDHTWFMLTFDTNGVGQVLPNPAVRTIHGDAPTPLNILAALHAFTLLSITELGLDGNEVRELANRMMLRGQQ